MDIYRGQRKYSSMWFWITAAIFVLLLAIPSKLSGYEVRHLTFIFMWIGLAGSLNIITGYTGYLDFGHVVFFGIGAYITGILMVKLDFSFFSAMIVGAMAATFISIIVGIATLRLRGGYFAIAMLAFSEAIKHLTLELKDITGGGNGLSLPIYTNYLFFYYIMLSVMTVVVLTTYWIEKSKFGYALKSIREAELAAEVSGVPTLRCKLAAFAISAFQAGAIGSIYAYWMTFLYPGDTFNVVITVNMVIMTFLGGAGTILGPVIGASFLATICEILWAKFIYTHLVFVGVIMVLVVLLMPQGIVGLVRHKIKGKGLWRS